LSELAYHGLINSRGFRQQLGVEQADLDIILADLEKEGRIKRTFGKHGELILLED
jgi:DNA-binding MarR family transcriptional regulator